jgi:hypothetical protein
MGHHLPSSLELPGYTFRLVDEQDHDMENGLLEMDHLWSSGKLPPQSDHLVEEQLKALDLHLCAREAVEQRPVLLLRSKQLAQQNAHHFPVSDHPATGLDGPRLRCIKELGNHDRRRLDAAHLANEIRVRAFACARRPSEQDQLLGESHSGAAELSLQLPPDRAKDELRVLDFQFRGISRGRQKGCGSTVPLSCCSVVTFGLNAIHARGY